MQIIDPATGSVLRELDADSPSDVRAKVQAARLARHTWAARPFEERAACIARFRQLVIDQREELAKTLTAEVGKPIAQSRNELDGLMGRIDFFLDRAKAELEDELVAPASTGTEERIRHEPLGVVANVSAWNYPWFVGANVFVPALLTGNAVVYKPSEYATLTGLAIGRALHDAGVPEDVFAVAVGGGEVGAALIEQPVDGVFFTGSYATGAKIAAAVAPKMVRLQLELGGKDPAYVMDDVDVASAAAAVADGAFYNTGQSCCAVERIYVHRAIYDAFVEAFVTAVRGFVLGDPRAEDTYIGALARRDAAVSHLQAQVADATARGATVLTGGRQAKRAGWFFEPTVLTNVDHSMRVMTEETFGPVSGIMLVGSDEEALEVMSDTEYGLTGAVYSVDQTRAERLLSRLDVGTAYWNCCDRVSPRLPWTGRRHSGVGCTLSTYGIEAFLRPKAWHLRP